VIVSHDWLGHRRTRRWKPLQTGVAILSRSPGVNTNASSKSCKSSLPSDASAALFASEQKQEAQSTRSSPRRFHHQVHEVSEARTISKGYPAGNHPPTGGYQIAGICAPAQRSVESTMTSWSSRKPSWACASPMWPGKGLPAALY